jgi:hypothetical protein
MTYQVVTQVPEAPIGEQWTWITDIGTSYNGAEDRIPLLRYPRRSFNGSFRFDNKNDLRRHIAMMTKRFKLEFKFPLFQYQAKLKAKAEAGDTVVYVNAKRGDFKVGDRAFIIEGNDFQELIISALTANSIEFETELFYDFSPRAIVCPLSIVYTNTNANVTRLNPDDAATSSFAFFERVPTLPFVNELNEAVVDTFDGLPLLSYVPIGTGFESNVVTGLQAVDYTGLVDFVTPWTFEQWGYPVTFKAERMGGVDDLAWWQAFADVIQGSSNPFLFPTNRSDLQIAASAAPGGNQITIEGDEYSQHYYEHGAFSRIFIDTDAGRHYAKITGIAQVSGNDRLTFTPALPAGAGWANNQRVGFLLKVRNDDDKIVFDHYGLWTEVTIALRTVV